MEKETAAPVVAALAPSYGPAVVSLFGIEIPILALALSVFALVLARMIAPPSPRKLTFLENVALTTLLCIILFLAVIGEITGKPLGVGMAVVWAIGLGFSGLLVVETLADRVRTMLQAAFGHKGSSDNDDKKD